MTSLEPLSEKEEETEELVDIKKEVISWVLTLVVGLVLALFVTRFVVVNAYVPSDSMLDTIQGESRILGSRLSYLFIDPKRFDIIVFVYPDSPPDEETLFVKRIIGLPGETIEIIDGEVYINEGPEPLIDDFVRPFLVDLESFGPAIIPPDSYFVMGDNRTDSADSRFWINTFVTKEAIVGRVLFNYWPQFMWHGRYKEGDIITKTP